MRASGIVYAVKHWLKSKKLGRAYSKPPPSERTWPCMHVDTTHAAASPAHFPVVSAGRSVLVEHLGLSPTPDSVYDSMHACIVIANCLTHSKRSVPASRTSMAGLPDPSSGWIAAAVVAAQDAVDILDHEATIYNPLTCLLPIVKDQVGRIYMRVGRIYMRVGLFVVAPGGGNPVHGCHCQQRCPPG